MLFSSKRPPSPQDEGSANLLSVSTFKARHMEDEVQRMFALCPFDRLSSLCLYTPTDKVNPSIRLDLILHHARDHEI